jgi:hypothetical protein
MAEKLCEIFFTGECKLTFPGVHKEMGHAEMQFKII